LVATVIIKCPYCAGLFLSGYTQKTKLCTYCGKKVNLQKALRLAQAANAMEASEMLKQLKIQNGKRVGRDFRCV
jgi:acetyl-CoA carboxylase beta subunit